MPSDNTTPKDAHALAGNLPEFDPISDQHEALMSAFAATHSPPAAQDPVQRRYTSFFDDNWRTISYKFLVSRKWNMADASKMYAETVAFRKRMRFHERAFWPPAFTVRGYDLDAVQRQLGEPMRPEYQEKDATTGLYKSEWDRLHSSLRDIHPRAIHFWDKTGHPVIIEVVPSKHKELVKRFKECLAPDRSLFEAWEDYHWHISEVAGIIMRYQNRTRGAEFGRDITSATVIMECSQLGYGILFSDVLKLSEKIWAEESKVVPEGMHRVFVVNCPGIITFAYGLLKHIIPKRTQEKIVFCGKAQTTAVLTAAIDVDKLPKLLGGTCECEGGCL